MTAFSPATDAALAGDRATAFAAFDIITPTRSVYLLAGAGFVRFGGNKYVGHDDVFGSFSDADHIEEGVGSTAPSITISVIPPSDIAVAQVAYAGLQMSPMRLWLGVVDVLTGLPIGDPLLVMNGFLNTATVQIDENGGRKIDYEMASNFEWFFLANDMARLSNAFHDYLWPGEQGCSFVTWVAHQLYFGQNAPDGVTR